MTNDKAVVLLSGGQDSATALLQALDDTSGGVVACVFVDYGQRHLVEGGCARWWCEHFSIPMVRLDLPVLRRHAISSLVLPGSTSAQHPQFPALPSSFVPFRNVYLLTAAASVAVELGSRIVYAGMCMTDYSGYPDCRAPFIGALSATLTLALDSGSFEIRTPIMHLTKAQTFFLAEHHGHLDAILEHTHTCYEGDREHRHAWGYGCSRCPACKIRAEGYNEYLREHAAVHARAPA